MLVKSFSAFLRMACKLSFSDSSIPYFAFSSSSFFSSSSSFFSSSSSSFFSSGSSFFSSSSSSFFSSSSSFASTSFSSHNPLFFRISSIISFLFFNSSSTISRSLGSCPFASLTMSVCFFSVNFSRIFTINIIFFNSSFAASICVVFLVFRVSNSVVIASFNFFIASFNCSVWSECG